MTADVPGSGALAPVVREVEFVERRIDHADAAGLLQAFFDEQVGRYGFAESIDLDLAEFTVPNGTFLVVYQQGAPVGCGGCRWFDRTSGTAEIKRTYLAPAVRGRGIGRELLNRLEHQMTAWGARRIILETGVRNTAALALFVSAGYRPVPRYVTGRDPLVNRAFAKTVRATTRPPGGDVQQAKLR